MTEGTAPGLGVEAAGNAVIDPTKNVIDRVELESRRQDDLRDADRRLTGERYAHVREIMSLRAQHAGEIEAKEAARLDAIHASDVSRGQQEAVSSQQAAGVLAQTVTDTAEAMRNQMSLAATQTASALVTALSPLTEAIADLRKTQYEQAGQKVQITESHATGASRGLWIGLAIAVTGLLSTALLASVAIVVTLLLKP